MSDPISPDHYQWHPFVECIDITEWMNFNLGNAVKYIWRHESKGNPIQDLQKARWYLDREIGRLESLQVEQEVTPSNERAREAEWRWVEAGGVYRGRAGTCVELSTDEEGGSDELVG